LKKGFLYCLLCSERPINEIVNPRMQDQRSAMYNQFAGMTDEVFDYGEYENVRAGLIKAVQESLTEQDKEFLLGFKRLEPDWSVYNFSHFPAISWKIKNLDKLKEVNPAK